MIIPQAWHADMNGCVQPWFPAKISLVHILPEFTIESQQGNTGFQFSPFFYDLWIFTTFLLKEATKGLGCNSTVANHTKTIHMR